MDTSTPPQDLDVDCATCSPSATTAAAVGKILQIMERLRGASGCAWTKQQTLATLWPYMLEEAHEAAHAARVGDFAELREELGDVLLQVVYQSAIAHEQGHFDLKDVAQGLSEKLVRRHPHVFARQRATSPEAVARQWEAVKEQERAQRRMAGLPAKNSRLEGLPATLPALVYAQRMTDKAASVGFDWPSHAGAAAKVTEELREVLEVADNALVRQGSTGEEAAHDSEAEQALEGELGDLLLAVVNLCRHCGVQAEGALLGATQKFTRRFKHVEQGLQRSGAASQASLDDMQRLWDEAKSLNL